MAIGPVQMLVLGFEGDHFTGEIAAELDRLKDSDVIRLVDLLFVKKDDDGSITVIQASQLSQDEAMEFGALVGALVGLGMDGEEGAEAGAIAGAEALEDGHVFEEDQAWYVADTIPNGTSAAIALLEHRWAIPLRDAIVRANGIALADRWIHATDLVAIGLLAESEVEAHGHG